MKKFSILIGWMLVLAGQVALAQTPTPQDTSSSPQTQVTQPPPATTPPPAPAPTHAPPPAQTSTQASQSRPRAARYGSISGSWLTPSGDFDQIAGDGWAITLEGYQFIQEKIAVGSQVGYQSFGEKSGVSVSNFPVDAVLKIYPKPGTGKADLYLTGGIGFNYHRTDFGYSTSTDYYFGTQAGVGVELHTSGPVSFVVDGVYHWIFSSGVDTDFIAVRGGLVIPLTR